MDSTLDDTLPDPDKVIELLRTRAATLGLEASSDEELFEAVLSHDVQTPEPDEAECHRYYAQNADSLRQGDVVEADHILFAVTPGTPIDPLRRKAEEALHALMVDVSLFTEMARSLSNCPSAQVGGNLGQLSVEQCVPEFWQALMTHGEPGLLPRLVRSRYGLHIVRVNRLARGQVLPFEALHAQIAQTLRQQSLVRALLLYAEDLGQRSVPDTTPANA